MAPFLFSISSKKNVLDLRRNEGLSRVPFYETDRQNEKP
jgi:hypothetical protein